MPDRKMVELCTLIANAQDPIKLNLLMAELLEFLNKEQDAIKAKIQANLMNRSGDLPY